jgi:hypothetical protein
LFHTLTRTVEPAGTGVITCGEELCEPKLPDGGQVELVARPLEGYAFAGWRGCTSTGLDTCEVTINSDMEVSAAFMPQLSVTPEPPGENCANGGIMVQFGEGVEFICNGTDGSSGGNGAQGPTGSAGANGRDGVAGPQGPRGPAGPPGNVTCRVHVKDKKVKVTCTVKSAAGANASRVQWRLTRHGQVVKKGIARRGRVHLGALSPGHYRLHVAGRVTTEIVIS